MCLYTFNLLSTFGNLNIYSNILCKEHPDFFGRRIFNFLIKLVIISSQKVKPNSFVNGKGTLYQNIKKEMVYMFLR